MTRLSLSGALGCAEVTHRPTSDVTVTVYDHHAVRIVHNPTGEASDLHDEYPGQLRNREAAWRDLSARLGRRLS